MIEVLEDSGQVFQPVLVQQQLLEVFEAFQGAEVLVFPVVVLDSLPDLADLVVSEVQGLEVLELAQVVWQFPDAIILEVQVLQVLRYHG